MALIAFSGLKAAAAPDPAPLAAADIVQELRQFRELGGVLYVAAHPDDENSRLLAYLARGRACRTAYLSLTRGDGGQNLIGPELGEELGVIRTQELLGARRIDGARQFFSRARDFGFSKDYRQTLGEWDEQQVLADIVRTIRTFRPDVIITRFAPWPAPTHGQHTASAYLALKAFKISGDPKAFPEQLGTLQPWKARRIVWNSTRFGSRGGAEPLPADTITLDAGGYQPLMGEWFGVLAARSRSMQRTQGMGAVGVRGEWHETFRLLDGDPAAKDLFDGIDTTWNRLPGGADIGRQADEILAHFQVLQPSASVPALLNLRRALAALPESPLRDEKSRLLDRILQGCLGLYVETTTPEAEIVPGQTLALRHAAIEGSDIPVRWMGVRRSSEEKLAGDPVDLVPNRQAEGRESLVLPASTPVTQPFWLTKPGSEGMFAVADSPQAILPENPPVLPLENVFEVGGQELVVPDQPVQVVGEPSRGEIRRALTVIPPISLEFSQEVELFGPGASRHVSVEVTAARAGVEGSIRLETPAGWQAEPAAQPFHIALAGQRARFVFTVTAPARTDSADIVASAAVRGATYNFQRIDVRYDHIPEIIYQPVAKLRAVSLELAIRGHRVGYLPGAGDRVAEGLQEMGYTVVPLTVADLTADGLSGLDAVVLGVRCFNVHADLGPRLPALWRFVQDGGNLIVQYNTNYGLKSHPMAPIALQPSGGRITDEKAPVTFLAPDHPALTTPNRIGAADFEGWVQERARYLPSSWDPRFVPVLACTDPGEAPNSACLLVAPYGQGHLVYSGLSWFHEIPAGVPGAYRLLANLVSLGK